MPPDTTFEDDFNDLAGETATPQDDTDAPASDAPLAVADAEPLAPGGEPEAAAALTTPAAPAVPATPAAPATPPAGVSPEDLALAGAASPATPAAPRLADVLALLPPEQAELYKPLVHRAASDDGRQAALQRLLADERRKSAQLAEQLEKARSAPPAAAATPAPEAEPDALDEYPELAKAVTMRLQRELTRAAPPAPQASPAAPAAHQAAEVTAPSPADEAEVTALASEYDALNRAHPDWTTAVNSSEFQVWLQRQPPAVQAVLDSTRAADANWLLSTFKRDVAEAKSRIEAAQRATNQTRLASHAGVRGTPTRVTAPPDDFEAAFNFYASR